MAESEWEAKHLNNDFPRLISLLRKERGISQKDAAKSLGISQALLSHYENGAREPGLDFVCRACEYYGVSADYLLGRTDEPGGETAPRLHALAEELRALAARVENAH